MEIVNERGELPSSGTVIVGVGPDGALSRAAAGLDAGSEGLVHRAVELAGKLEHGGLIDLLLPRGLGLDRLILAVCGKPQGVSPLDLEELGGAIARRLVDLKVTQAALASFDGLDLRLSPEAVTVAVATGARLRAYRFDRYKTGAERAATARGRLSVYTPEPIDGLLQPALAVADAVTATRDLVSEPANVLTPAVFADACRDLAGMGIEVEVLDGDALEGIGMRALLGVAQGSVNPPYVVVMRWRGADAATPMALIGKGVCFDSGGISIKPAGGMEEMKWDMAGAGAVVGAMRALAGRKAKADVVGVVGLVENMPSGTAQRPGDVVRTLSGKTVEVINTDAEGRLVLADLLAYTADRFKPQAMIDLATLTGAVIVALGHEQAGLFANDEALATSLRGAGEAVGERLWRLPLGKAYAKHVKSEIADLKNVGRGRDAGATAGAVFLEAFVGDVPWAHLDIAGVAWSSRDSALAPKGATGFGVRLLDRLVREMAETGSEPAR